MPVLALPDGQVIDQSLDIMLWALARCDAAGWLNRVDKALVATNDGPFKHHLDRAKYPDRYGEEAKPHRDACISLLEPLEDRLAHSLFLCGDEFGLTDAAILPFVRQFALIDRDAFDALPMPHLRSWLDQFLTSPLFGAAMLRVAPWKAGEPEICFPS